MATILLKQIKNLLESYKNLISAGLSDVIDNITEITLSFLIVT